MRTTINIPDGVIREVEELYNTKNRSRAIENALRDAVKLNKLRIFKELKSRISFDEDKLDSLRKMEMEEK